MGSRRYHEPSVSGRGCRLLVRMAPVVEPAHPAIASSGAEEHEPDHAQDQYRKPGRDCKESENRWAGFGLAGLGRGFDDLTMLSGCHAALDSLVFASALRRHLCKSNA